MNSIHPDLEELADSAQIVSPTTYVVLGQTYRQDDLAAAPSGTRPVAQPMPEEALDWAPDDALAEATPLVCAVRTAVYGRLYTRTTAAETRGNSTARRVHCMALSAANRGNGSWEPGWMIAGEIDRDGRLPVTKGGITFWTLPAGVRIQGENQPGVSCHVKVPKEFRNLVPGFYCAIGDADLPDEATPAIRLYWHLTAAAAAPFLEAVSTLLNARGIPYRAKVLSDPDNYRRADSGVLYIARDDWDRTSEVAREIYLRLASQLHAPAPMFAKPLAPGLALAEEPANGLTFGQHRCGLAAVALWRAFLSGAGNMREFRLATIVSTFRDAGIDPERPFLNPGSTDRYCFETSARPVLENS